LDIFSGSGCLGIATAKNIKNSIVDFSDIDENNIKQIKINLKLNNIKNYKKIIKSDVFSKITGKYDLIIANPPYAPASDAIKAPFEPLKAITAGKDGLNVIRPFIAKISMFLSKNGLLIMEYHPNQINKIKTMLIKHGFKNFEFYQDQYKRSRYVLIKNL
jgi:HemK-like putative methylase